MNIDIREHIKSNFKDSDIKDIKDSIESSLKENDEIIKIDGIDTRNDIYKALTLIQESKNEVIEIEIKRNKEYLNIKIKPDVIKTYCNTIKQELISFTSERNKILADEKIQNLLKNK